MRTPEEIKLSMEIEANAAYTPQETRKFLKISPSTLSRLLKKGLIHAAKVGKQYRIMGKEILRILSPQLEDEVGKAYNKVRHWVHEADEVREKTPLPVDGKNS